MEKQLEGKVALITGSAAGQGLAMAKLFAKEGAKVVLADIANEKLQKAVADIKKDGYDVTGITTDLGKEEQVKRMVQFTLDIYSRLDILVNNAGIMDYFQPVGRLDDQELNKVFAVNTLAPFYACRAAIQVMNKQDNGGVIVNNSSIGGLFGARAGAAYTMSKHALMGLTKNIAATYGAYGKIRANAIAPGGVASDMPATLMAQKDKLDPEGMEIANDHSQKVMQKTMATNEQLANVALFLASDQSSAVNGAILVADGGLTVR